MEATFPLAFAHLARCAAAIRARPAADSVLRGRKVPVPFRVEMALPTASSCELRRLRSCSS